MAGKGFLFASWIILLAFTSSIAAETEDVIQLDLSQLRVDTAVLNPPQHGDLGRADLPPKNDSKVYCTNSVFPNDIFCDIGGLGRIDEHEVQPLTTDFFLKFRHPNRTNVHCFVSFGSSEDGPPSKLEYESFGCFDASDPEVASEWLSTVEWKIKLGEVAGVADAKLPKVLKLGDMDVLEVEDVSPVNLALKCKRRLKKSTQVVEMANSVAFDVDSMACISTAPYPEAPSINPQD